MKTTIIEFTLFLSAAGLLWLTPRLLPLLSRVVSKVSGRLFASSSLTHTDIDEDLFGGDTIQDPSQALGDDNERAFMMDTLDLSATEVSLDTLRASRASAEPSRVNNDALATSIMAGVKRAPVRRAPDEADMLLSELKAEKKGGPIQAALDRSGRHTVRLGETLRVIAYERLGDSGRWFEIWKLNYATIQNPQVLVPGTKLRLPKEAHSKAA